MPYKKLSELNEDDVYLICSHKWSCVYQYCQLKGLGCGYIKALNSHKPDKKVYVPNKKGKYLY